MYDVPPKQHEKHEAIKFRELNNEDFKPSSVLKNIDNSLYDMESNDSEQVNDESSAQLCESASSPVPNPIYGGTLDDEYATTDKSAFSNNPLYGGNIDQKIESPRYEYVGAIGRSGIPSLPNTTYDYIH